MKMKDKELRMDKASFTEASARGRGGTHKPEKKKLSKNQKKSDYCIFLDCMQYGVKKRNKKN